MLRKTFVAYPFVRSNFDAIFFIHQSFKDQLSARGGKEAVIDSFHIILFSNWL